MRHLRFQINIVLMSFLVLSGISLASPIIFGSFRSSSKLSLCSGHNRTHLSRAQCLQLPGSTAWKRELWGLAKCQDRPALEKYCQRLAGVCYTTSECEGEKLQPPSHFNGWPAELCYENPSGHSFRPDSNSYSCFKKRDWLKNVAANVHRGNCYLPEAPGSTAPVRPLSPPPPYGE